MIYIDAFGETGPCVFIPMTFGNIRDIPVSQIWNEMRGHFPSEGQCFINKNYNILKKHNTGQIPLSRTESLEMMKEISFGGMSRFNTLMAEKHGS